MSVLSRLLVALILCAALTGCAVPRVTVVSDPLSAEEHIKLGEAYLQDKDLENAEAQFKAATRDSLEGWPRLAWVRYQRGDLPGAQSALETYVERRGPAAEDAAAADALNNLAWILYERKTELDRAESLARRAHRLAPGNREYLDTLEKVRAARGAL